MDATEVLNAVQKLAEDSNSEVAKVIGRDSSDRPVYAVVCVRGVEATAEFLSAVETLEARWEDGYPDDFPNDDEPEAT
jgi:hypothetical protein